MTSTSRAFGRLAAGAAVAAALAAAAQPAMAREGIRIVGSTTVLPFSAVVIEQFVRNTGAPSPVLEGTGSGGGFKLFCEGIGADHPDMSGATRPMKEVEYQTCLDNGVDDISVIELGYDGIVLANSIEAEQMSVSFRDLYLALAREVPVDGEIVANPYERWSEVNPELPDVPIMVIGPPPTSSARDFLAETVMEAGCDTFPAVAALRESDPDRHSLVCRALREDGGFVEAGENDNVIMQRLVATPEAFGIFGYIYLDENRNLVAGNAIEGVEPTYDDIVSGDYPLKRTLRLYIKNRHREAIPGMDALLVEYVSESTIGPDGYLVDHGLIVLPDDRRAAMRERVQDGVQWVPSY